MKCKRLLLMLLLAFLAPWAAQAQQALPYSYGFENNDLAEEGWTTQNPSGLNASEFGINTSAAKTGTYGFRFSSYNDDGTSTQYLISPELDATAGVIVQFYYKVSSLYTSGETFQVGYSTTNTDISSFTFGSAIDATNTSWAQTEEYTFPAGTKYVAVYYSPDYQYRLYVDDFTFEAPSSCPKPTLSQEVATTATTATVSWTPSNDGQQLFDLYWATSNTAPTEATTPSAANQSGTSYEFAFADLNATSTYYVWVRGNCGTATDPDISGGWAGPVSFETPCDAVTTFPWSVDFEDMTANTVPQCWDNSMSGSSTLNSSPHYIWGVYSYNNNQMLRMYNYYVYSGTTIINSPTITLPAEGDYELSFKYSHLASCGAFTVKISEDGGTTFVEKGSYSYASGSYNSTDPGTFTKAAPISLAAYAGKSIIVQFNTTANYGSGAIFVDDVKIDLPAPTIASVVGNTPLSTTITWTGSATATGYAYQYKLATATDWGTETTVGATVLSANLTTEAEEDYDFRVRAIYGENYSGYATTSFTTPGYCMVPSNLTITNVTDSEATFSWTEEFGNGEWKFGYKKNSETEYTYVDVVAADLPITLDVFEEQTEYDVVVYPLCDETKTLEDSFTTMCGAITIPAEDWTENFNSYTTGVSTGTSAPTGYPDHTLPDCWNFLNISATSSTYPQVFLSSSTTYAVSGNCLFFKSSSTTPLYAILPAFSENISGLQLTFTYRNEGVSSVNGTLYVGYMTDPADASTFASVQTCTQTTTKTELEVTFEDAPVGSYIAFKYEGGSSNNYYASIDDVTVGPIPTCLKPSAVTKSDVTNHSATLSWTNGAEGQTAWQIAYKAGSTFDPTDAEALATATVIDVTTNPYTFSMSLDAATTYYMYVRANCGDGNYSKWSKTVCSFTTLAAAPAPTAFTASNIGPNSADLTWTAPAGDFLSGYELYYVAATETPEAPTAETEATVTVTLEEEMPYTLEGLTAETQYYIWVRANHGADGYSAWTALTGSSFTTTEDCPVPTDLEATNITHYAATIRWTGFSEDYTVQYRTPAGINGISEDFSSNPTDWTFTAGALNTDGTATLSGSSSWSRGTDCGVFDSHIYMNMYSTKNYWLITPSMTIDNGYALSMDIAYTKYSYNSTNTAPATGCTTHRFAILISTDNQATWTILREWNNSGSDYVLDNVSQTGESIGSIDLSAYAGETAYIAFFGHSETSDYDNNFHFDNVTIGTPVAASDWQTADRNLETAQLSGLTAGNNYEVRIQGICGTTTTEWSDIYSFTTIADNVKIFVTEGDWNEAGNWMDGLTPTLNDNAQLQANATITGLATAGNVTIASGKTLTIADGGQLQHNNSSTITATVKKNIKGYSADNANTNNGYVLLAPPFGKYIYQNNSDGTGLRNGTYDLYSWARTTDLEWTNYGSSNSSYLYMYRGTGYLYANQEDTEITFAGSIYGSGSSYSASVSYTAPTAGTTGFSDWNLLGNPFVCKAYLVDAATNGNALAYYKMNADGNDFEATTGTTAIAPMEGVFYQATEETTENGYGYVYFTRELPAASANPGTLNINLAQAVTNRGEKGATDNAIIRFGEGNTLGKFSFNENSAKVYIPQNGKDYAVVNAGNVGEMPVNFKANENGSYTLSFSNSEVTFSYLHLIDNMTGADVDLLATPSYTFDARYTDYASRFRLVFATGSSANGENFGFVNASGNLSIFGIEGTATLQVIDVTGRMLSSETFSGSYEKRLNAAPGVYMLRLIQGNDVKVQKMVVR